MCESRWAATTATRRLHSDRMGIKCTDGPLEKSDSNSKLSVDWDWMTVGSFGCAAMLLGAAEGLQSDAELGGGHILVTRGR